MESPGVQFVFSPALYPQSPLLNYPVFLHGKIIEVKERNGERTIRAKDEKGEWEGYTEKTGTVFQPGDLVRGYGLVVPQPDGKMMLAAKWIKKIETNEWDYCVRKTNESWPIILGKNPTINELKPFEMPKSKPLKMEPTKKETKSVSDEENDFVSAHELKVEREYL